MFQCKDLLTLSTFANAKLISGKNGLNKVIRWGYKAESLQISKWVHGEELIIVSGMIISEKNFDLYSFISQAIKLNISGALLLIGPNYIETIPKKVLDLSNKYAFPLFAIAWNTPLVDIFEEMGHAITLSRLNTSIGTDIISGIIFENNASGDYIFLQAEKIGYDISGANQFFIIHFDLSEENKAEGFDALKKEGIKNLLLELFDKNGIPLVISDFYSNIICLTKPVQSNPAIIDGLLNETIDYIKENFTFFIANIGVGAPQNSIGSLKLSYEQATKCITLSRRLKRKFEVQHFNKLGLYQLFFELNNDEILENYADGVIGSLADYDEVNHTELVPTLKMYLKKNCNLNQTADALFIHRNTIKYRIRRIEEISGQSLDDSYARLNFQNALMIKEFLS